MVCGEPSYIDADTAPDECPHCGDIGTPANLDETATVTLTKHELRILTFWADAYSRLYSRMGLDPSDRMVLTLKTILDRLSMQTDTPLSLSQDLANIRTEMMDKFGDAAELVVFDASGRCVECDAVLDMFDSESLFEHNCGVPRDQLPASEEDLPPFSS
jgi:hypothetical protein